MLYTGDLFGVGAQAQTGSYEALSRELVRSFPQVTVPRTAPSTRQLIEVPTKPIQERSSGGGSQPFNEVPSTPSDRASVPVAEKGAYTVQFKPNTSTDKINELLGRLKLRVVGGIPEVGVVYLKHDDQDPSASMAPDPRNIREALTPPTVRELRSAEIVASASVNSVLTTQTLPPPVNTSGRDRAGKEFHWTWEMGANSHAASGIDGNWGMKYARFPAAWSILRARDRNKVVIGVLDVGFNDHEDLPVRRSAVADIKPHDHGNHVAGIIGASFDNAIGIAGGAPGVDMVIAQSAAAAVIEGEASNFPVIVQVFSDVIGTLVQMISAHPDMKIINLSLGYNWMPNLGIDPSDPSESEIRSHVINQGRIVHSILTAPTLGRGIVFVAAAGNDARAHAPNVQALWASPFNWAALQRNPALTPPPNAIVVEAIDRFSRRAPFSNIGGHVSAPGVEVLSAIAKDQKAYAVLNGTSMAAPHVAALAALLLSHDPKSSVDRVVEIIKSTAHPSPDAAAPHIDALEALLRNSSHALLELADLNKDGQVNRLDYEIFYADLAQIEQRSSTPVTVDLNGDGAVTTYEHAWPRVDLNGSGIASTEVSDRRLINGRAMTDLDVLKAAWTDPDETPPNNTRFGPSVGIPPSLGGTGSAAPIAPGILPATTR